MPTHTHTQNGTGQFSMTKRFQLNLHYLLLNLDCSQLNLQYSYLNVNISQLKLDFTVCMLERKSSQSIHLFHFKSKITVTRKRKA